MAARKVEYMKGFTNLSEVADKMLEMGFFVNEGNRDERVAEIESNHENWFTNGVLEVKIFRGMFGFYELANFKGVQHPQMVELFEVAKHAKFK